MSWSLSTSIMVRSCVFYAVSMVPPWPRRSWLAAYLERPLAARFPELRPLWNGSGDANTSGAFWASREYKVVRFSVHVAWKIMKIPCPADAKERWKDTVHTDRLVTLKESAGKLCLGMFRLPSFSFKPKGKRTSFQASSDIAPKVIGSFGSHACWWAHVSGKTFHFEATCQTSKARKAIRSLGIAALWPILQPRWQVRSTYWWLIESKRPRACSMHVSNRFNRSEVPSNFPEIPQHPWNPSIWQAGYWPIHSFTSFQNRLADLWKAWATSYWWPL